jgi:hypothetical protein
VRGVATLHERDRHAGPLQACRIFQGCTDLVEAGRQVGQHVDEHRHLRGGQLRCQLPGFAATGNGDLHLLAGGPAQQLADVRRTVHLHHDAALAGQVAAQRAAPGRGQQRMR